MGSTETITKYRDFSQPGGFACALIHDLYEGCDKLITISRNVSCPHVQVELCLRD